MGWTGFESYESPQRRQHWYPDTNPHPSAIFPVVEIPMYEADFAVMSVTEGSFDGAALVASMGMDTDVDVKCDIEALSFLRMLKETNLSGVSELTQKKLVAYGPDRVDPGA